MPQERDFSHFAITVSRISDALPIYRECLGFTTVSRTAVTDAPSFREIGLTGATMGMLFLERDGVVVELQEVIGSDGEPVDPALYPRGVRLTAFRVADVDVAISRVLEGGGSFDRGTMTGSDANAIAFTRDPEGNRVEFVAGDRGGRRPHTLVPDDRGGLSPVVARFEHAVLRARDPAGLAAFYERHLDMSPRGKASDFAELMITSMYYGDFLNWRGRNDPGKPPADHADSMTLRIAAASPGFSGLEGFCFSAKEPHAGALRLQERGATLLPDEPEEAGAVAVRYENTLLLLKPAILP